MNYKRHRPKEYWHSLCCKQDSFKANTNGRKRIPFKDQKQPQFYDHRVRGYRPTKYNLEEY